MAGHTIVCGLDPLGLRIVEELHGFGEPMIVLDTKPDPRLGAVVEGWGIPYRAIGASIPEALMAAGIATADAVVCAHAEDVVNLELALFARSARADVRVVVRLANEVVRGAVAADNGPGAVLNVADLAAPSVVDACLRKPTHRISIAGRECFITTAQLESDATLRQAFGDLGPIAITRGVENPYAGDVVACPPRDTEMAKGDWAALIGTADELRQHGLAPERHAFAHLHIRPPRRRNPFARFRIAVVDLWQDVDPNFFRAMAAMLTLMAASTLILRYTYNQPGMSYVDAWYFTVETIATVGYGDFNFIDQPSFLRIFAIFLMVCGIANTAVLVAFLSDLLVSRRIAHTAGRRRARTMKDHVLIVGLGVFGIRVAADLISRGKEVVVIESNTDHRHLAAAEELDVPVVFGNATLREDLAAAGVTRASAVAVLTSNEMVNIEVGLVVRNMLGERWTERPGIPGVPVVLRVFDLPLGQVVAQRFGFKNVRSTVELSAPWFIGAAEGLDVMATFSVWQQSFMVGAVSVQAGSVLAGTRLLDLSAATRVVAIAHAATGETEHNPRRESRLHPGDVAYLIGPYAEIMAVLRLGRAPRDGADSGFEHAESL